MSSCFHSSTTTIGRIMNVSSDAIESHHLGSWKDIVLNNQVHRL